MVITVPNIAAVVLLVLVVVLMLALVQPRPQVAGAKWCYVLACVFFACAALGLGYLPWLPIGLFCMALGFIVG